MRRGGEWDRRTGGLDGSTEADLFWGRQAALPNCSSIGVEVPGHQQESYPFKCKNCGLQHDVVTTTEKGIDTSMTTYLLETAERWQTAVVVTRDVDLVPPVLALRRKGKRVFVVADAHDPPSALARACQQFVPINSDFLAEELGTFRLCREDGVFEKLHGTHETNSTQMRFDIALGYVVNFIADPLTRAQHNVQIEESLRAALPFKTSQAETHTHYSVNIQHDTVLGLSRRVENRNPSTSGVVL